MVELISWDGEEYAVSNSFQYEFDGLWHPLLITQKANRFYVPLSGELRKEFIA